MEAYAWPNQRMWTPRLARKSNARLRWTCAIAPPWPLLELWQPSSDARKDRSPNALRRKKQRPRRAFATRIFAMEPWQLSSPCQSDFHWSLSSSSSRAADFIQFCRRSAIQHFSTVAFIEIPFQWMSSLLGLEFYHSASRKLESWMQFDAKGKHFRCISGFTCQSLDGRVIDFFPFSI